jgi:CPA2 family monovalent cation:H+ antiporter-2
MNEGAFFQDLAMLMAAAGLVSVVFAKLKFPKVVGYIFAGVLLGKYTWGGSFLADEESVRTIGQLGVVFLMFTMGLGFSTSQMKRIRGVALPAAILDTVVMTWLGYTVGRHIFGWGTVPSLFLGAAICDSATTMLAKVIDEMRWGDKPFVKYALGTSVCEDIATVGILALVTGVAQSGTLSVVDAGASLGGLFVFFLVVIVAGFVLLPRLLKSVSKTHDDEALLLAVLGCCFLVSWVAFKFEFSLALGAFLVGFIGAASDVKHRLAEIADPLKSMFAAVFFVSIGLLFDPSALLRHWREIMLITGVVMFGKIMNCTLGGLFGGEDLKTALQMGMGLASLGEFAFLVGMLYVTVTGDAESPMYNIVVAVSLITTLLNPLMIKYSEGASAWVESKMSARVRAALRAYRTFVTKYQVERREARLHKIVRKCILQLGVIAVLNFAVAVIFSILNGRDWSNFSRVFDDYKKFVFCLVANLFFVSMFAPAFGIARALGAALATVLKGAGTALWQQAIRHLVTVIVQIAVVILFFCEMVMINVNLTPDEPWARWVVTGAMLVAGALGWKSFQRAGHRAATHFTDALMADERLAKVGAILTFKIPEGSVHKLTIDMESPAVGGTVVSLNIRAKTGASIISVERNGDMIRNVGPETEFRAGDILYTMGNGAQIAALKDLLGITA